MKVFCHLALWLAITRTTASAKGPILSSFQLQKNIPALPLNLYKHLRYAEQTKKVSSKSTPVSSAQIPFELPPFTYPAHTFQQKVSHDPAVPGPSPASTFAQRYWFDASFYKPGGPVFLLDGGETSGEDRVDFLKQGILRILSEASGGIGVVLEHRYYGESFPVLNLTTDSLRFLTTSQSLFDSAYFAQNVVFSGVRFPDLNAPSSPWIYYGGSYAGAKSALARKLFPEVFWGAIASSAVTVAIIDYWEYMEPIRINGPKTCISLLQNHTTLIDTIINVGQPVTTFNLKKFFGLPNVTRVDDFVNALTFPLGSWQGRNWDPSVGSNAFFEFCDALVGDQDEEINSGAESEMMDLFRLPELPPLGDPRKSFASFRGYAEYIKENVAGLCPPDIEQDDCFGTGVYQGNSLQDSGWKSWAYQFCTEWGYLIGAPPPGHPAIISSLLTPEYAGQICQTAFPQGKLNQVPLFPNVTLINQYGGFDFEHSRLAFIDGSEDPWIYATPHSPNAANPNRLDTISQPFKIIKGGVHHWDENGRLDGRVPKSIQVIHGEEVWFVLKWLDEWEELKAQKTV